MKAILIPHLVTSPMTEVEGEGVMEMANQLWTHPGDIFPERVNTYVLRSMNLSMAVDEDFHDKHLPPNYRAMILCAYRGGPICGDVFLLSESAPPDVDWVDVPAGTMKWLDDSRIQLRAEALTDRFGTKF